MAWYDPDWLHRKPLTLTGGPSGGQSDFQLAISVSYAAAMQGDFDDIRFTQADGTTQVDVWAEVIVIATSAIVLVEFPTTPANTVEQDYYMYYGNSGAASDWDGSGTFAFFDDGEGRTDGQGLKTVGGWVQGNTFNGNGINEYSDDMAYVTMDSVDIKFAMFDSAEYHPTTSDTPLTNLISRANGDFDPDFVISIGDILYGSTYTKQQNEDSLDTFEAIYDNLTMDRHYCFGNHELDLLTKTEFMAATGKSEKYYSFDVGDYHFIVLDAQYDVSTNADSGGGDPAQYGGHIPPTEMTWLQSDLSGTSKDTFVFCHQCLDDACAGSSTPGSIVDNRSTVRGHLESSGKVRAVFSGHRGTTYRKVHNGIYYYAVCDLDENAAGAWFEVSINSDTISVVGNNTTSYIDNPDAISFHLEDAGGEIYHSSAITTLPQTVECEMYVGSTDLGSKRSYFSIYEGGSGWAYSTGASLLARGTVWYVGYGGTEYATSKSLTIGWHKLTLIAKSDGSADMYVDDDLLNVSVPSSTLDNSDNKAVFGTYAAGHHSYIDRVRCRKYVSGPPTYAFGSEESAPTGHPAMRRWGGTPGMQYTGRRSW